MKILINGVYIGGNCPPFYHNLKKLGHDVKVIDVLFFNQPYSTDSSKINHEDIIYPRYLKRDWILYKFYQKTYIKFFLNQIISRLKKIIKEFNPDIIINHQTSIRADLIRLTDFCPVVNYIYGSEIKRKKILRKPFKKNLEYAHLTLTTTPEAKTIITKQYPDFESKIENIYYSFIAKDELCKYESCKNDAENHIIVFDNRTLRDKELTIQVFNAYLLLAASNPLFHFIIIQGFSGKLENLNLAKQLVHNSKNSKQFVFYEDFLDTEKYFELLNSSNIVTSFLPVDQFGEVIIHAMFLKKYLLLKKLPQYENVLNNDAIYVEEMSALNIVEAFNNYTSMKNHIDLEKNRRFFEYHFDSSKAFLKIEQKLNNIVYGFNKVS
jgi:hypothetical protein